MKRLTKFLIMNVAVAGCLSLVACSDRDNDLEIEDPDLPSLVEGATDLTHGRSVVIIENDDELSDGFRFQLATKKNVKFSLEGGKEGLNPLNLRVESDEKGIKHLVADGIDFDAIMDHLPLIYHVNLTAGDEYKDMTLILRSSTEDMSPDEEDANVLYSYARETIGRGVDVTSEFGPSAIQQPVLTYKTFTNKHDDNLVDLIENTIKEGKCWEWGGERFTQTHYEYSWSLGFKGQLAKKNGVLKGSLNVNQGGSETMMANYEYYICALRQERNDVSIHSRILDDPDLLYAHMDKYFNEVLNDNTSKGYAAYPNTDEGMLKLVQNYGTHLLTKATFGGLYTIVYSRQENMHEKSIGEDISASIKRKFRKENKPEEAIEKWWQALGQMLNSSYIQGDIDESWYSDTYDSAVKGSLQMSAVGHDGSMDLVEWKEGCDAGDVVCTRFDKYYANGVRNEDTSNLIPLYDLVKDKNSERYNTLKKFIDNYIDERAPVFYEDKLILTDFMMKAGNKDEYGNYHAPGEPKVLALHSDYANADLLYLPLYVNYNGPTPVEQLGHALDTNQDEYVVGTSNRPHYWYCAYGYASEVPGIIDIRFGKTDQFGKGKKDDNGESMEYYQQRGDHANEGIVGGALNNNYVWLRPPMKSNETAVITAIGLADNWENHLKSISHTAKNVNWGEIIIASTPGAEYRENYLQNKSAFNNWWTSFFRISDPQNGEFYEGYSTPWDIRLVFSNNTDMLYNWYDPDDENTNGLSWGNGGLNSGGVSSSPVLTPPFQYARPWD
ncbi:MAG: hypothetical protein J1F16_01025 [Muribaculaceae bacterium]|nr:hypothetical protein [Muribaculaceae bacterium]